MSRLLDLTAASVSLASFDAPAVARGLAIRLLGPVPQLPKPPEPPPINGITTVPGLGRVGFVAAPGSEEYVRQLNGQLTAAYRDRRVAAEAEAKK